MEEFYVILTRRKKLQLTCKKNHRQVKRNGHKIVGANPIENVCLNTSLKSELISVFSSLKSKLRQIRTSFSLLLEFKMR